MPVNKNRNLWLFSCPYHLNIFHEMVRHLENLINGIWLLHTPSQESR